MTGIRLVRRAAASTVAAAAVASVSACALWPTAPDPLPDSFVPDAVPTTTAPSIPVGSDGFTIAERTAMRVWALTCSEYVNGSAWALDANTVVTNRHVVEDAMEIEITSYDGQRYYGADIVLAEDSDVAIVTVDRDMPEWATIADDVPESGDTLTISGYPDGDALVTQEGPFVTERSDPLEFSDLDVYEIGVHTVPGSSGSAVVNTAGDVVGVLYAGSDTERSWAVTLPTLTAFLDAADTAGAHTPSCG